MKRSIGDRTVPNGALASGVWSMRDAYESRLDDIWPLPLRLNGLVLHLDASNDSSYPNTSTTWYDLSSTIGNVNINNRNSDWSFTTDPSTGLECLYANTDRPDTAGINIPTNNGFNKAAGTIETWIKPVSYSGATGIFTNSDGESYTNATNWLWIGQYAGGANMYFRQGNSTSCCNQDTTITSITTVHPLNTWKCWAFTWDVSAGTTEIYVNGSRIAYRENLPTDIPNSNPTTTGQLFNSHNRTDNQQFRGYCNIYRIYNRALSSNEVLSNFTVCRDRFGV